MSRIRSTPKPWTAREDKKLRALYPTMPNLGIGEHFGRTDKSVASRAKVLRLDKGTRKRFTEKDDAIIRKLYRRHTTVSIAKILNRRAMFRRTKDCGDQAGPLAGAGCSRRNSRKAKSPGRRWLD